MRSAFKALLDGVDMAANPQIQSGRYPEAVNAAGDNGQKEPFNPVAKELAAGAVKGHTFAVNYCVADDEFHHIANGPRGCNAAGEGDDQAGDDHGESDESREKSALDGKQCAEQDRGGK